MSEPRPLTAEEIRAVLLDAFGKLESGDLTPAEANAITKEMRAKLRTIEAAMRMARVSASLDHLEKLISGR